MKGGTIKVEHLCNVTRMTQHSHLLPTIFKTLKITQAEWRSDVHARVCTLLTGCYAYIVHETWETLFFVVTIRIRGGYLMIYYNNNCLRLKLIRFSNQIKDEEKVSPWKSTLYAGVDHLTFVVKETLCILLYWKSAWLPQKWAILV